VSFPPKYLGGPPLSTIRPRSATNIWTIGDRSSLVRDPSLSCSSLGVENEVWNEKYTQCKTRYIYSKFNHYNVWSGIPF
jgi:hypothetical protein